MTAHRLTRSRDRVIGGVCGGLAEFVGWAPVGVRALYVFVAIATAVVPGTVAYAILWWTMPEPEAPDRFKIEDFRRQ